MNRLGASIVGLSVTAALSLAPVLTGPAAAAPRHAARPSARTAARSCCRVPAGTLVEVELAGPVSTKVQKSGDSFALRLAEPLVIDGRIVLRAGTPGVGAVIESSKPGLGGKAAKLVLAARYLSLRGRHLALQGLQMSSAGHDNSTAAQAVGLTGIAFAPLGFIGLAVRGGDVELPAGTRAVAKLADDTALPSLGRAPRGMASAAAPTDANLPTIEDAVNIPPPPPGMGEVVFFRAKSLLGTGQWFSVRENGKALGKLSNGAYFIQVTEPGVHTYTAATEPELKDRLKLEVDPGETYYVEGALTKGVVIGTANIFPSDRAAFDKAKKGLKIAAPVVDEKADVPPSSASDAATSTAPSGAPAGDSAAATARDSLPAH